MKQGINKLIFVEKDSKNIASIGDFPLCVRLGLINEVGGEAQLPIVCYSCLLPVQSRQRILYFYLGCTEKEELLLDI